MRTTTATTCRHPLVRLSSIGIRGKRPYWLLRSKASWIQSTLADPEVMFHFQKGLYRRKYFDYDARGQIISACRCILGSEGN
jgi:hypothetical protein